MDRFVIKTSKPKIDPATSDLGLLSHKRKQSELDDDESDNDDSLAEKVSKKAKISTQSTSDDEFTNQKIKKNHLKVLRKSLKNRIQPQP